jgi:hypothetical protein
VVFGYVTLVAALLVPVGLNFLDVQDLFAERLRKKGFKDVIVPEMHETHTIA